MNLKITSLCAFIASIQFAFSVPIPGDLTDIINTGSRVSQANPDGPLYGFRYLLDDPLCGVGLGCDECDGPLSGLQTTLGDTINSLGLGADCHDKRHGHQNVPIRRSTDDGDCNGHRNEVPINHGGDDCKSCGNGGIDVKVGGADCE